MTDKAPRRRTVTIVDRIADALCDVQDRDLGVLDDRIEVAEAIAAVVLPRIVVVELPEQEPDSVRVDEYRTVIYEDTFWLTPDQARADAAALLAAAQKAEENA